MRAYLTPLIFFQRFFIPALIIFLLWALWRLVARKDRGVGVALYLALVVIVDFYMNTGIYLPGLEKGSIRYSEVCAILIYFGTPAPTSSPRGSRAMNWLVSLYFLLMFVATLHSDSVFGAILEFRQVVFPQIVAVLIAKRGLDSPQEYRRFFLCLAALTIVIGVFTFWDLFFDRVFLHSDVLAKGIYSHNRKLNRFGSFFLNPNYMGGFVALVFPGLFVWTLQERSLGPRLLSVAGLLSLVFCLVETQSRAPMLAFTIGLVFLLLGPSGAVSRVRRFGFLAVFMAVFLMVMPGFFEHAIGRFDKLDEETTTESGHSRATTWLFTARMIADHPLTGIGFGEPQFMKYMDLYGFGDQFEGQSLDAPHNSYLQVAVYAGIPTLLLFLAANALLLGSAAAALTRAIGQDKGTAAMLFGLCVGVIGFLLSIYPDIQLFTVSVAPAYWVFFGFAQALTAQVRQPGAAGHSTEAREPAAPVSWWTAVPDVPNTPDRVTPWRRPSTIMFGASRERRPDAPRRSRTLPHR